MAIAAGKLDRRITLQRLKEGRWITVDGALQLEAADEYNDAIREWVTLAIRSASYEPLSDGERFRAGETAATASARFVIRHSAAVADLNPRDRLTFEGSAWEIVRVKEIGRRQGLEISATVRADG